jgi:transketolase
MDKTRIKKLRLIAQDLRITGLRMVQNAHSGHIGGAFSLSEIMAVLYFEKMNIRPNEPKWEDRDRLVMSKGHATVALYPALAMRGFFPVKDLDTFRHIDGHLSGHVEMNHVPGVDMSTGSLGQGFSVAAGIAVAGKQLKKDYTVYAILGDGEIQEGQIWEACMYAGGHNLDNLIAILDNNKVQLDGTVVEVLNTGDLTAKFASFGFEVIPVDGHDVEALCGVIDKAKTVKGKPVIIIANTIKGKGVSFMEGKSQWHGKTPDETQFIEAFEELASTKKKMEE